VKTSVIHVKAAEGPVRTIECQRAVEIAEESGAPGAASSDRPGVADFRPR